MAQLSLEQVPAIVVSSLCLLAFGIRSADSGIQPLIAISVVVIAVLEIA